MFRRSHKKSGKRAAVLGCGPAGLFATHAMMQNGWNVTVYSNKRKSEMYGAQYLHAPIVGLTSEQYELVDYRLTGTAEEYRNKVYGVNPIKVSVETLEKQHKAWDIRTAYNIAWALYSEQIVHANVTPQYLGVGVDVPEVSEIRLDTSQLDVIINTIPLRSLCYQPDRHQFHSIEAWAIGDAPERGVFAPFRAEPFTVECNGEKAPAWYRSANVFGYSTVEWPAKSKPPIPGVSLIEKPLYSDCDCYRSDLNFIPLGRYGQWAKGVLAHEAYTQAAQL